MRPLENLVCLANLLSFFVSVSGLPRMARWTRHAALMALLVAVVQISVEGPRWQMGPAYVLALVFFLGWLLHAGRAAVDLYAAHRLTRGMAVGLGVLGLAISALLPTLMPVFRFPAPADLMGSARHLPLGGRPACRSSTRIRLPGGS